MSLCFRCEHRAKFLEGMLKARHDKSIYAPRPRHECGDIENSKCSCYMFQPCKPIVTVPSDSRDKRPRFGPAMISSREMFERVLEDAKLDIIYDNGREVALGWRYDDTTDTN